MERTMYSVYHSNTLRQGGLVISVREWYARTYKAYLLGTAVVLRPLLHVVG